MMLGILMFSASDAERARFHPAPRRHHEQAAYNKTLLCSGISIPCATMEAWLTSLFGSQSGLVALFLTGFLVAMFIPGGAEIFLFSSIKLHPQLFWQAIAVASLGNVLAGMTTYWIGRLLPEGKILPNRAKGWLRRIHDHGQPIMLIAWVPWLGEAICIAAGWLRLNFPISALFLSIGIFARFWLTALAAR